LFKDISQFRQLTDIEERSKNADEILRKYPSLFLPSEKDDILQAIGSKTISETIFDPVYTYIRNSIQQKCDDFIEEYLYIDKDTPGAGKKGVLNKLKNIKVVPNKIKKSSHKSKPKKSEFMITKKPSNNHIIDLIKSFDNNEASKNEFQEFGKFIGPMESDLYFFKELWDYINTVDKTAKIDLGDFCKKFKAFSGIASGTIDLSLGVKKKLSNELSMIEAAVPSKLIPVDLLITLRNSLEQIIQQQYTNFHDNHYNIDFHSDGLFFKVSKSFCAVLVRSNLWGESMTTLDSGRIKSGGLSNG